MVDHALGSAVRLRGHVARANPVAGRLDGGRVLAVFAGPHAYVTPRWYAEPRRNVPTWNYVVAEVRGRARVLAERELHALLDDLCARFEPPDGYRPEWVDGARLAGMMAEIVGFEIAVDEVRGKFKLSQNRTTADRVRVMRGLEARDGAGDRGVLEWMRRVAR